MNWLLGADHLISKGGWKGFFKKKLHPLLRLKKTSLTWGVKNKQRRKKVNPTPKPGDEMLIFDEEKNLPPSVRLKKTKKKKNFIHLRSEKNKTKFGSDFFTQPKLPCSPENKMVCPLSALLLHWISNDLAGLWIIVHVL